MSVVIKDMDKPMICADCQLCMIYPDETFDEYWCMRLNRAVIYPNQDVLSDCPIEEYNDMWTKKMSNGDWINFLVRKFDVSRTIAKEMLHSMMEWKKTDRFNKQFCGSKDNVCQIKT